MKNLYLSIILLLTSPGLYAQAPTLSFLPFLSGLTAPVDIVNASDGSGRLFIVQQNGIVRLRKSSGLVTRPFLNMSSLITYSGERGLLSIAFHPNYANNRYFFVFYNNAAGDIELAQYRTALADPDSADAASRKVMLTITKPYDNHNGCKLNFGPDSLLYFAPGDGGSGGDPLNLAQNLSSLLGKMLRIRVDSFNTAPYYTVPASNPLVGVTGTQPEIFDWGLRNPWRWSFDRLTGDMWIADVGQGAAEEVNMVPASGIGGNNFGWRCYEGNATYNTTACGATPATGKTFPIFTYGRSDGYSITGGYVYRGAALPGLYGYYICADFGTGNGWLISPNGTGGWNSSKQAGLPTSITTFGEAEDGTLYAATIGGAVYRITLTAPLPIRELSITARNAEGQDRISWTSTQSSTLNGFEVLQSRDGSSFEAIGRVAATGATSTYVTPALPVERFYRVKAQYTDGSNEYSAIIRLAAAKQPAEILAGNVNGGIWLTTPEPLLSLNLYTMNGQLAMRLGSQSAGKRLIETPGLAAGLYILECRSETRGVQRIRLSVL